MKRFIFLILPLIFSITTLYAEAESWPAYMFENSRSGISDNSIAIPEKNPAWVMDLYAQPSAAWPEPARRDLWHYKDKLKPLVAFDRSPAFVAEGDKLFFGSNRTGFIYCVNGATGVLEWKFYTGAPVRFAPVIYKKSVICVSDSGYVFSLDSESGKLNWKSIPEKCKGAYIMGNGFLINRFACRSGILADGQTGYFTNGIFPTEGVFYSSINLDSGKILETRQINIAVQGYMEQRTGRVYLQRGRHPAGKFLDTVKITGKANNDAVKSIPDYLNLSFIGSRDYRFAGGQGAVACFDRKDGKKLWEASVTGDVYNMAVCSNRLYASTDAGYIYCFSEGNGENVRTSLKPKSSNNDDLMHTTADLKSVRTIQQLIKNNGIADHGLCLIQSFDMEVIRNVSEATSFKIYIYSNNVQKDSELVFKYGLADRVFILDKDVVTNNYLFDIVVSDKLTDDTQKLAVPGIGLVINKKLTAIYNAPELDGAGSWTHIYANPSNTASSSDRLVKNSLALQWFGEPGPRNLVDRHLRNMPPLSYKGRLVVPGNNLIYCMNLYNGSLLWSKPVYRMTRTAINMDTGFMACNDKGIYVASDNQLLRLDYNSGETISKIKNPVAGDNLEWGYIALKDDFIIGSAQKRGSSWREMDRDNIMAGVYSDDRPQISSSHLFVLNSQEKPVWTYSAENGPIANSTITILGDKIFFIESRDKGLLEADVYRAGNSDLIEDDGAYLKALSLSSGKLLWKQEFNPGDDVNGLFMLASDGKIIISHTKNAGTVWYNLLCFDADSGKKIWSVAHNSGFPVNAEHGEQNLHPLIIGNKIFSEPVVYELATGKELSEHNFLRPGHSCGTTSASAEAIYYRANNPVLYDMDSKDVYRITESTRPGCWINMIPAGGVLAIPEASSGCTCSYAIQTSLVFIPEGE